MSQCVNHKEILKNAAHLVLTGVLATTVVKSLMEPRGSKSMRQYNPNLIVFFLFDETYLLHKRVP